MKKCVVNISLQLRSRVRFLNQIKTLRLISFFTLSAFLNVSTTPYLYAQNGASTIPPKIDPVKKKADAKAKADEFLNSTIKSNVDASQFAVAQARFNSVVLDYLLSTQKPESDIDFTKCTFTLSPKKTGKRLTLTEYKEYKDLKSLPKSIQDSMLNVCVWDSEPFLSQKGAASLKASASENKDGDICDQSFDYWANKSLENYTQRVAEINAKGALPESIIINYSEDCVKTIINSNLAKYKQTMLGDDADEIPITFKKVPQKTAKDKDGNTIMDEDGVTPALYTVFGTVVMPKAKPSNYSDYRFKYRTVSIKCEMNGEYFKRIADAKKKIQDEANRKIAAEKKVVEDAKKKDAALKKLADEALKKEEELKKQAELTRIADEAKRIEEASKRLLEQERLAEEARIKQEQLKKESEQKRLERDAKILEEKLKREDELKKATPIVPTPTPKPTPKPVTTSSGKKPLKHDQNKKHYFHPKKHKNWGGHAKYRAPEIRRKQKCTKYNSRTIKQFRPSGSPIF